MSNLNKFLVFVPNDRVNDFKTTIGFQENYFTKIAFLGSSGEVMTNGQIFGVNRNDDIENLQNVLGTNTNAFISDLGFGNDFDGTTIVSAIKYIYDLVNSNKTSIEDKLDIIQGNGEGSISKTVDDAIVNLLNGAPDALNTLKEIADWISNENGQDAATLVSRVNEIENQVSENERVNALSLIHLQNQINDINEESVSIHEQIENVYDNILGNDNESIDSYTLKGLRSRIDYNTLTGTIEIDDSNINTLSYNNSNNHNLATVENIAQTINSIELWETFSDE